MKGPLLRIKDLVWCVHDSRICSGRMGWARGCGAGRVCYGGGRKRPVARLARVRAALRRQVVERAAPPPQTLPPVASCPTATPQPLSHRHRASASPHLAQYLHQQHTRRHLRYSSTRSIRYPLINCKYAPTMSRRAISDSQKGQPCCTITSFICELCISNIV